MPGINRATDPSGAIATPGLVCQKGGRGAWWSGGVGTLALPARPPHSPTTPSPHHPVTPPPHCPRYAPPHLASRGRSDGGAEPRTGSGVGGGGLGFRVRGSGVGGGGLGFRSGRIRGSALLVALARLRPRLAGGSRSRPGAFSRDPTAPNSPVSPPPVRRRFGFRRPASERDGYSPIVNGVTNFARKRENAARGGPFWDGRWLGMRRFPVVMAR